MVRLDDRLFTFYSTTYRWWLRPSSEDFYFSLLISESNDNTFDDSIQCFLRNHAATNVLPYKTRMLLQMCSRTRRNDSTDSFGLIILLLTMLFDKLWLRMCSRTRRHSSNNICCRYVLFRFTKLIYNNATLWTMLLRISSRIRRLGSILFLLLVYILYIYILCIYVTPVLIFHVVWAYWSDALLGNSN